MKNVLDLKVGGAWMVLSPDTSISIEMTSPLWNDSGTFSYTFQVPYFANRHIFNASNRPESDVNLKTFRKRFELYTYGLGFLFGDMVCTSDEIDIENDRIDVELRSANATFEDAIDGKSLRDLDLGEVVIGKKTTKNRQYSHSVQAPTDYGIDVLYAAEQNLPYSGFTNIYYTRHNGSTVYPAEQYINIPIIINGLENEDSEKKKFLYISPYRAFSSPCFFVAYLLKQIFRQHSFAITKNEWDEVEDLRRLIILNTHFSYKEKETSKEEKNGMLEFRYGEDSNTGDWRTLMWPYWEWNTNYDLIASAENLPDTNLSELISSLKSAFGVRILVTNDNHVRIRFLRNIFRSNEVKTLSMHEIMEIKKRHLPFDGIVVKYSEDQGEEYSYKGYNNVTVYENYTDLLKDWTKLRNITKPSNPYTELLPIEEDITLRVDKETGNFYRTKVDKKNHDEPRLFEVAQFNEYKTEGFTNEDSPEESVIGFSPIIPSLIGSSEDWVNFTDRPIPTEAFYVDAEIDYNKNAAVVLELAKAADGIFTGNNSGLQEELKNLLDYDCGFTLGIIRTSPEGSLSENYTIVAKNVDGFGNDEWVRTLCTTTVTSDSVSRDGALFDYNGTDEGIGTPMEQLVSLKLWSGKQNFDPASLVGVDEEGNTITGKDVYNNNPTGPLPNRGLVPQFLSEYLHFMKHRKPISVVGYMHVSELVNIEWDKYHEVAGYRGLLDKIKFTLSMEGISPVTVEHFVI